MIPEQVPAVSYFGNNSAINFEFNFYIEKENELSVVHTNLQGQKTTLVKDVDYSIYECGNENGSYITFPLVDSEFGVLAWDIQSNKKEMITISLNLPISQEIEYDVCSNLDQTNLEKCFDYLTRICQIQERKIARSIKVSEGANIDTDDLAVAFKNVSGISNDVVRVSENVYNVANAGNNIENIITVSNSIVNVDNLANSIQNVNVLSNEVEKINAIAPNIADIINLSNKLNELQNILQAVQSLPDSVKVGLVWKDFTTQSWNQNGEYFTLTLLNLPAPIGVFRLSDNNKIFVNNVDMIVNDNNCVLVSFEPFTGTVLGSVNIVETVESQNNILNELSSIEISEIKLSDLD